MAATASSKCLVCNKTVYAMEKVSVEGKIFHEGCFKCAHCKKKLSPGTYTAMEDTYYCKPHYTQLFTSKGNYSDAFGKERPTAGWAPSTATYDPTPQKTEHAAAKPAEAAGAAGSGAKPPGPPGPPPPAPPPLVDVADAAAAGGGNDQAGAHAAALASIAAGGHKLKHVSREDRKRKPTSSVVPGDSKPKETKEPKAPASGKEAKKGPPELKLDGIKWKVRFFENRQEDPVVIDITDIKQSVSISDCSKSVILVKGKITNISIMNSTACGVIFDDIIASAEVVRCEKIQVQANGKIAQICIDKTNGCDVFIQSEGGKDVELVTSLTDAVNVNFPGAGPDDDPVEYPIPAQFTSVLDKGKLITTPVSHV